MPPRRVAGQQLGVDGHGLALGRRTPEDDAPEDAADVRVGERDARARREARDRARGVPADAGERIETIDVARQAATRGTRDAVQVPRTAVVAEAAPRVQHVAE